ncbi:unnamed protein product [Orchesella dallaii]|uniref:LRAT domain-containing protein n=1 Tax=Orchesella dallaii TaxID=48710 RepID=A0ABP1QMH0_9HEXA
MFGVSYPLELFGEIADKLTEWTRFRNLNDIKQSLNPGDLVEFHRGLYSHYALNLGDGNVMNVCAEDKNVRSAKIKEMRIEEVCRGSQVRIRNHDDVAQQYFQVQPKSTFEIIRDAKSFENQVLPYEFDFRNCEYYSTLWRYGKGFSTQVATTAVGLVEGILAGPGNTVLKTTAAERYTRYLELARK